MICTICKKDLPLEDYYLSQRRRCDDKLSRSYGWCKRCHVRRQTEYELSPKGKFVELKKDAKKRNIAFFLTLEDVVPMWNGNCAYCGNKLKLVSLDRVDNLKAYTLENTVPCCRWCNYTKGTSSAAFFYEQCRKVVEAMPQSLRKGDKADAGARYLGQIVVKRK